VAALESRAADGIANYANVHELSNPDNAFHLYRRVLEAKTCMEEMQRRPGYFIGLPAGLLASYLETSNEWPNLPVECLFFANAKISENGKLAEWMAPQAREEVLRSLIGIIDGIAGIYENALKRDTNDFENIF